MGIHDGCRADVFVVAPEDRTGGGARSAQDALRGVVVALALFWALPAFPLGRLLVVDQEREDPAIAGEERFHVDHEVLEHAEAADRLDGHLRGDVPHQHLARERVPSVDHHRVRTADPVRAGPSQGQAAFEVPLDLVESVEQTVRRLHVDGRFLPPGLAVDLRPVPPDPHPEWNLSRGGRPHPGPRAGLPRRPLLPHLLLFPERRLREGRWPHFVRAQVLLLDPQYFLSMGTYGPRTTSLYSIVTDPSRSQ